MIRDLYDNSIVAYKTATQQTVNLVLDTIRQAVRREKKKVAAELQLNSDQGGSIHLSSIFPADSTIRNYAFDVKTWKPVRQCDGRKFLLHSQNRVHLPPQTSYLLGSQRDD